jgi:hypothetical protein
MLHQSSKRSIASTLLLIGLWASLVSTSTSAQSVQEFIPNDPQDDTFQDRQINLPAAIPIIRQDEANGPIYMTDAIIVVMDSAVNSNNAELQNRVLTQYNQNFTDDATFADSTLHGTGVAAKAVAECNNGVGICGVAGSSPRVKIISFKVLNSNLVPTSTDRLNQAFQQVLTLKGQGVNIVAITITFNTATNAQTLQLITQLHQVGVIVFVSAGNFTPPQNLDDPNVTLNPASLARQDSGVVVVSGLDTFGLTLDSTSNYGKLVSFAAPSVNVPLIFPTNLNASSHGSGTSVTPSQVAAAYALVRLYREPDADKAMAILKHTATALPTLGISYGIVDVYGALAQSIDGSHTPLVVTQGSQSISLDSVSMVANPPLNPTVIFGADGAIRVMVLVTGLDLWADEPASSVSVQLTDQQGHVATVPAEYAGKIPTVVWARQVIFKVPSGMTGQLGLSVMYRNKVSSNVSMTLR